MLQKQRAAIENALLKFHAENPAATGIAKDALRQRCLPRADAGCFDALLDDAVARRPRWRTGRGEPSQSRSRRAQAGGAGRRAAARDAGRRPGAAVHRRAHRIERPRLLARPPRAGSLEKQGLVRRIGADFYFDVSALAAFEQAVRARLADGPATAAELKDAMGTSRKYAIPLLEYFDSQAVTRREGDTRVPGGR
ncbi:MAG: SelB C-terminal domain-containing protein [Eggerthella lenta]